jgi:chemotaxis protein methyltransferase CheR
VLDGFCRIGISRFYRDRSVFQFLEWEVLPRLAQLAGSDGESEIRCWSVGCARGEEPYTLAIVWRHGVAAQFPALGLTIVATDADAHAIRRAERGCYSAGSLKELPVEWRTAAFAARGDELCLKDEYRRHVTFLVQDIREGAPQGMFHFVLCRNLVFTYFDEALQGKTLQKLSEKLAPGGALLIGRLESLPAGSGGIEPWSRRLGVYRKPSEARSQ